MQPKIVELPDGSEIEFPPGMSANEIGAVLFNQSQPGKFLHRMFNPQVLEPYRQAAGELALDVLPVTGEQRSVRRLGQMADEFGDRSTVGKYLTGADMTLEGAGLAAGVVPGLKAAGAGLASLGSVIPLMARGGDNLSPLQKALRKQLGITGYHGSPHKFDKFDHSMMGSGEGAQAYGWGTYLAENPDVANVYVSPGRTPSLDVNNPSDWIAWMRGSNTPDNSIAEILQNSGYKGNVDEAMKSAERYGNLYEVDLPDDQIAKMLDWDAPLSEQPENIQKAMREMTDSIHGPGAFDQYLDATDGGGFREWSNNLMETVPEQQISEGLNARGIPGIKYWDGGSRSAGEGTRNFVVFDEDLMTILKRNDEALQN